MSSASWELLSLGGWSDSQRSTTDSKTSRMGSMDVEDSSRAPTLPSDASSDRDLRAFGDSEEDREKYDFSQLRGLLMQVLSTLQVILGGVRRLKADVDLMPQQFQQCRQEVQPLAKQKSKLLCHRGRKVLRKVRKSALKPKPCASAKCSRAVTGKR